MTVFVLRSEESAMLKYTYLYFYPCIGLGAGAMVGTALF